MQQRLAKVIVPAPHRLANGVHFLAGQPFTHCKKWPAKDKYGEASPMLVRQNSNHEDAE